MDPENVVSCQQISRTFITADAGENRVLQGIDLEIQRGECVVVIGPSGCGKSTLINIVAGFDRPTEGHVYVGGKLVEKPGPDRAVVFQDYALLPWHDALDNVAIGLRLNGMPKVAREKQAQKYLATMKAKQRTEVVERCCYLASFPLE